jgi:arylsulfatase A-like enzyme
VIWFGNPHAPHEALPSDKAVYSTLSEKDQNYYGELHGIDRNVGKLRAALRELKIADNTLVWYTSDNGGAAGPKSTGNLRGSKGTLWEGGLRVPGIIEWPARIAKPFVSDMPCSTLDIYQTVLAATGAKADKPIQPLDGINLLPLFDGKLTERGKAIPLVARLNQENSHAALLDWPYKLHTGAAGGDGKGKAKNAAGDQQPVAPVLLFDVSKDPKETTDLAAQQPERVAKMQAELTTWKASALKSLAGDDYGPDAPIESPSQPTKKAKKAKT